MNKGRLIVAYICLVGVPLLGLIGILRAGARLTPPRTVRGNWIVETDLNLWHGMPCEALLTNATQPLMNIAQSGRDVTVTLNNPAKTILLGTIDGPSLIAAAPAQSLGCQDSRSLRVVARVVDSGKERSLKGTFTLDQCPDCAPLPFSALRQIPEGRSAR